jgi:8-oxo-dGTP pyrophosphatase MutT (NUDIX family)
VISRFDIESLKQRLNPTGSVQGSDKSKEPVAAVAIIIDIHRDSDSILLMRRQDRAGDPWSGQIAFPGGHKSPNDRTLLETAIREAAEEVGIELGRHEALGVLPLVYSQTRRVLVAPFVFLLSSYVSVQLNDEVAETFWVSLEELSKIRSTRSEVHVESGTLEVDSYVLDGRVVWGLTFRIIRSLLNKS